MSQTTNQVTADIYTQHHRYSGRVNTRGSRLADFLNDPTTETVELLDVQVSQPKNRVAEAITCPQVQLKKDAIHLAIPTGSYEAPAKRLYNFVEKQHYTAHVTLPGYALQGTLHLPSRANHWMLLSEKGTTPNFTPITDVTLHFAASDMAPQYAKVVIFRRLSIEGLFISEHSQADQSLQDITSQLRLLAPEDVVKQLAQFKPTGGKQEDGDLPLLHELAKSIEASNRERNESGSAANMAEGSRIKQPAQPSD